MSDFFSAYGGDPHSCHAQSHLHQGVSSSSDQVLDLLSHNQQNPTNQNDLAMVAATAASTSGADPNRPGLHERSVSASFLYAQEQDDPMLLQQHMIAQKIAWEQIQKQQQAQQMPEQAPLLTAAHGVPVSDSLRFDPAPPPSLPTTTASNRSIAPVTDLASHYSHPSAATVAVLPGLKAPPPPPSSPPDGMSFPPSAASTSLKPPPVQEQPQEPEPLQVSKEQNDQLQAAIDQAEQRLEQGQCPSCGQQLYKLVKVARWKQFLHKRLSVSTSSGAKTTTTEKNDTNTTEEDPKDNNSDNSNHNTPALRGQRSKSVFALPSENNDSGNDKERPVRRRNSTGNKESNLIHQNESKTLEAPAVATGANPAGLVRKKPLHIPGVVHRGQCVKCSRAAGGPGGNANAISDDDDSEEGEEEEPNNLFLRDDDEDFDEDQYLQNSILSPLVVNRNNTSNNSNSSGNSSPTPPPSPPPTPALANYQGPVNDRGERHGPGGVLTWSNGDVYKGSFVNGQRHGAGTITFAAGKGEYVGDWFHGEMHGQGTRRYANGDLYTGNYVNGQRSGTNGRFYFTNGDLYVGEWRDDQMHGLGRYYYHHGQRFEGGFCCGKRHGKGKLQRLDGSLDVFVYEHNVRSATGVRWSADRTTAWKLVGHSAGTTRKQQIPIAEAVSLVYQLENAGLLEPLTTTQHVSDVPDVRGTTV